MAVEQWDLGVRPEIIETRFVVIQGERFNLDSVVTVLEGLMDSDILNPIDILDRKLGEMLQAEGLAYAVSDDGLYARTEQTLEAYERLFVLSRAELAKHANPTIKIGYMCSTSFDYDLGNTEVFVYGSPEDARINEDCIHNKGCAVVKVALHAIEVADDSSGK